MAERDKNYTSMLFEHQNNDNLVALMRLHDRNKLFIEKVLVPIGQCLETHFKAYHSPPAIRTQLMETLSRYRKLILSDQTENPRTVLDKLEVAANNLAHELSGGEATACRKAAIEIAEARAAPWMDNQLELSLPYSSLGLAYLFYDSGAIDQAIRIVAQWISAQSNTEMASRCGSNPTDPHCSTIGYFVGDGENNTWYSLPPAYMESLPIRLEQVGLR